MKQPPSILQADTLLQHGAFVRSLARSLLRDEQLAEDVSQEVWSLWLKAPPRDASSTRSWLGTVVRNLSFKTRESQSRRAAREAATAHAEALPSAADEVAQASVLRQVVDAVLTLEEPYRATVLMRYFRGLDARRIAKETGVPLATVRSRLQRAHGILRERLDALYDGERRTWGVVLARLVAPAAAVAKTKMVSAAVILAAAAFFTQRALSDAPPDVGSLGVVSEEGVLEPLVQAPAFASAHREVVDAAPRPMPDGRLRISGSMVDLAYPPLGLEEMPSEGTKLHVSFLSSRWNSTEIDSQDVTVVGGAFSLDLIDPGVRPLYVMFNAQGDEHHRGVVEVEDFPLADRALDGVELQRASHGTLHGRVVDLEGTPLMGTTMSLRSSWSNGLISEAVSAEDGSFRFEGPAYDARVEARLIGYALLHRDRPQPLEAGGWSPMTVYMAREAAIALEVHTARGSTLGGVHVRAFPTLSELSSIGIFRSDTRETIGATAQTNAQGEALLTGLPVGLRLELQITHGGQHVADRAEGERLVFGGEEGGQGIVLQPGETRTLRARWSVDLVVEGSVSASDGNPVMGAIIAGCDLGVTGAFEEPLLMEAKTDAGGRFEARLLSRAWKGPLRLIVRHGQHVPTGLAGLGYVGGANEALDGAAAIETVDFADAAEGVLQVDFVLAPTQTITGRILGPDGEPCWSWPRVFAVPAGSATIRQPTELGRIGTRVYEDRSFQVWGLADGDYDLVVSRDDGPYILPSFLHRFPNIPAGASGVVLRLPEREEVRIALRVRDPQPPNLRVLVAKLLPSDPDVEAAPAASKSMLVDRVTGWPVGVKLCGLRASQTGVMEGPIEGQFQFAREAELVRSEELPGGYQLAPLGPGTYVIGILAESAAGERSWFPAATGPLSFEPGDYRIEFELTPTATVHGRVLASGVRDPLGVSLIDDLGELIPLPYTPGHTQTTHVLRTSGSGEFVLHEVPVGEHRLRVGTLEELQAGRYRHELPVVVGIGENPSLEIVW